MKTYANVKELVPRETIIGIEKMLFCYPVDWIEHPGGVKRFQQVRLSTLQQIQKMIDGPIDHRGGGSWNNCPGNDAMIGLMRQIETLTAHGYMLDPARSDFGIVIEGVEGTISKLPDFVEFVLVCRKADEFEIQDAQIARGYYVRIWFD